MVLSEVEKKMVLKHGTIQGKKNMLLLLPTCSAKNCILCTVYILPWVYWVYWVREYCWARKKSFNYPSSHGSANLGVRKKEKCFCLQIHKSPFLLRSCLLILLMIIICRFLMNDVLSISYLQDTIFRIPNILGKYFKSSPDILVSCIISI